MIRRQAKPNLKNARQKLPIPNDRGKVLRVHTSSERADHFKASRNSKSFAKARVYKQCNNLTSSLYPKAIIFNQYRHHLLLRQVTTPRAERYMPSSLLLLYHSADLVEAPQSPQIPHKPSTSSRKRKRAREEQAVEYPASRIQEQPPLKRLQTSFSSCAVEVGQNEKGKRKRKEVAGNIIETVDPLKYWTLARRWPKEYLEQHCQILEELG